MTAAIHIQGLSKSFIIGHQIHRYLTLRDEIAGAVKRGAGLAPRQAPQSEEFWALRDVTLDVEPGDRLGIIGRNGSGKSTLLKILSRITEPTAGRVEITGRVASLLEVGTGFHPELSGRENIFLSGAILGMSRAEIRDRFERIVEFAEVERFLDTPVKRYSSGMYVRLAFSVAAHLESDILLVDEVLAVGDAVFQAKCLGKMEELSGRTGRTVVFVSHNMGSIVRLCNRAAELRQGQVRGMGRSEKVVADYLAGDGASGGWVRDASNVPQAPMRLARMRTVRGDEASAEFGFHEDIDFECEIEVDSQVPDAKLCVTVQDRQFNYVSTVIEPVKSFAESGNNVRCRLRVPGGFLAPNNYSFRVALFHGRQEPIDVVDQACTFLVVDTGSEMAAYEGLDYGNVILPMRWIK